MWVFLSVFNSYLSRKTIGIVIIRIGLLGVIFIIFDSLFRLFYPESLERLYDHSYTIMIYAVMMGVIRGIRKRKLKRKEVKDNVA